ncbi:MAG: hypothetical protein NVS3B20_19440 [Polyangiales bacterium]
MEPRPLPARPAAQISWHQPDAVEGGAGARMRSEAVEYFRRTGSPQADSWTLELTIDPSVQAIAEQEIQTLSADPTTRRAALVALDPANGEVLALAGVSDGRSDYALGVSAADVPGSVMKTFSIAAALEQGTVRFDDTFDGERGSFTDHRGTFYDAVPHSVMTLADVVAFSSNIGAVKIFDTLGRARFGAALSQFRFGTIPPIQLLAAHGGDPVTPDRWSDAHAATIACGEGFRATPLQVASAFASIANGGVYVAPTLVRTARATNGTVAWLHQPAKARVLRAETAVTMMGMLEGVVHRDDGTGRRARIDGYRIAGKTGTAPIHNAEGRTVEEANYGSFVGAVPSRQPRFVLFIGVDTTHTGYAGVEVAAPSFHRAAERMLKLTSIGVPPDNRKQRRGGLD